MNKYVSKFLGKGYRLAGNILLGILIAFCLFSYSAISVSAAPVSVPVNDILLNAESVINTKSNCYVITITAENQAADFTGTVRVLPVVSYEYYQAYDTAISLPAGSTKQFSVNIPIDFSGDATTDVYVEVLDKNGRQKGEHLFTKLLLDDSQYLNTGILSDNPNHLSFFDLGGDTINIYGEENYIHIVNLDTTNLLTELDTLRILLIDDFDTSVLSESTIEAIMSWTKDGGVLIIGTGTTDDKTIKGFNNYYPDFLSVNSISNTTESNEEFLETYYAQEYYSSMPFDYNGLNITMTLLEDYNNNSYSSYTTAALIHSYYSGSISITPYALNKIPKSDSDYLGMDASNFLHTLYDDAISSASALYQRYDYYDHHYNMKRLFNIFGNSYNSVSFVALMIIVIVYVIFAGPILYLILRKKKKHEWYWVMVPATSLVCIVLIFFSGRGFQITSAKVFGVSISDANDERKGTTSYMLAYDAGTSEWDLKLSDSYEAVGGCGFDNDSYYYDGGEHKYRTHIANKNNSLYFGVKPGSSFENSYFKAYSSTPISNTITYDNSNGSITNTSNRNMIYLVHVSASAISVYEGINAGESMELFNSAPMYNNSTNYGVLSGYMNDIMYRARRDSNTKMDAMAAVGVCLAEIAEDNNNDDIFVAVYPAENNIVDDTCIEKTYDCVYLKLK